jgi:small-conductance mechanosensitive channel
MKHFFYLFFLLCFITLNVGHTQSLPEEDRISIERHLLQVLELEESLKGELQEKQEELRSPLATGRQVQLEEEVQAISQRLSNIQQDFTELAIGVELSDVSREKNGSSFSWSKELQDLLAPLIAELRDVTSRPREISNLKDERSKLTERKASAIRAVDNLTILGKELREPRLQQPLHELLEKWRAQLKSIDAELAITEEKLSQKQDERKSVGESIQSVLSLFFESRGKHLFFAFLVAALLWISLRNIPKYIISHLDGAGAKLSHAGKLLQVAGLVTSTLGAALAFLATLYLFEDWVLLLLFSLLFLGLLWTMKDTIPDWWRQLALLLNFGPVREGEVIEYNGILWRVDSISFYATLINEAFTSGRILRVPIQDLIAIRSRQSHKDEKLFPSDVGDHVILQDGTFGRVTLQSPDYVELMGYGGSRYHIDTREFRKSYIRNLRDGFGETYSFGIDYRYQSQVTEELPTLLREEIETALQEEDLFEYVSSLKVEFEEAAASSLNFAIVIHFTGDAAQYYPSLARTIQRGCVRASNKHGWTIPFPQLSVHLPEQGLKSTTTSL